MDGVVLHEVAHVVEGDEGELMMATGIMLAPILRAARHTKQMRWSMHPTPFALILIVMVGDGGGGWRMKGLIIHFTLSKKMIDDSIVTLTGINLRGPWAKTRRKNK